MRKYHPQSLRPDIIRLCKATDKVNHVLPGKGKEPRIVGNHRDISDQPRWDNQHGFEAQPAQELEDGDAAQPAQHAAFVEVVQGQDGAQADVHEQLARQLGVLGEAGDRLGGALGVADDDQFLSLGDGKDVVDEGWQVVFGKLVETEIPIAGALLAFLGITSSTVIANPDIEARISQHIGQCSLPTITDSFTYPYE